MNLLNITGRELVCIKSYEQPHEDLIVLKDEVAICVNINIGVKLEIIRAGRNKTITINHVLSVDLLQECWAVVP